MEHSIVKLLRRVWDRFPVRHASESLFSRALMELGASWVYHKYWNVPEEAQDLFFTVCIS